MTKRLSTTGKAAIAGAIGSAAIAAALLYVNRRKDRKNKPSQPGPIPSGEQPETD
jgi:4-hydroxybenzoate polyprenyltransferase